MKEVVSAPTRVLTAILQTRPEPGEAHAWTTHIAFYFWAGDQAIPNAWRSIIAGEVPLPRPVGVHDVDVAVAAAVSGEADLLPVG
jgi:hypothetical protein